MKQYTLIQEYPGSPKLGTTVTKSKTGGYQESVTFKYFTESEIESSPKFWQLIPYRITQLKYGGLVYTLTNKITQGYYEYTIPGKHGYIDLESVFKGEAYEVHIHQIVRVEDNAVFTVGQMTNVGVIKAFKFHKTGIYVGNIEVIIPGANRLIHTKINNQFALSLRVKLFTTVDGVDIFEGDSCYAVDEDLKIWGPAKYKKGPSLKFFSTHVLAAAYVKDNKPKTPPVFTTVDGVAIYPGTKYWWTWKDGSATGSHIANGGMYLNTKIDRYSTEALAKAAYNERRPVIAKDLVSGIEFKDVDTIHYAWYQGGAWKAITAKINHSMYPERYNASWFKDMPTERCRFFKTAAEVTGFINMQKELLTGQEIVDMLSIACHTTADSQELFKCVATLVSKKANA